MRLWDLIYNAFLADVEEMGLVQALIPRLFMAMVVISLILAVIQEITKHG